MNERFVTHIDTAVTNEVDTAKSPSKVRYETLLAFGTTHLSLAQEKCKVTALL